MATKARTRQMKTVREIKSGIVRGQEERELKVGKRVGKSKRPSVFSILRGFPFLGTTHTKFQGTKSQLQHGIVGHGVACPPDSVHVRSFLASCVLGGNSLPIRSVHVANHYLGPT